MRVRKWINPDRRGANSRNKVKGGKRHIRPVCRPGAELGRASYSRHRSLTLRWEDEGCDVTACLRSMGPKTKFHAAAHASGPVWCHESGGNRECLLKTGGGSGPASSAVQPPSEWSRDECCISGSGLITHTRQDR